MKILYRGTYKLVDKAGNVPYIVIKSHGRHIVSAIHTKDEQLSYIHCVSHGQQEVR